jgi:serine protease Do
MSAKQIVAVVMVGTLGLALGGWALSTLFVSLPPSAPASNSTVRHTDFNWTFPSESWPSTPLPDFRPVVSDVMPSVVSVTTESVTSDFFGRQYTESHAGSGIIIDDRGYIATNNHVVEDAQNIYAELIDGTTFPADIVGADALTDLAVIKIDATELPYAYWGNSSSLSVGDWVLAIGNALGEGVTATEGIVSRLDVSVDVEGNMLYGLVQTTAAINPGNSGGPLVNMSGEVMGINSIKIVSSEVEGIGYAISSDAAKPVIEDLIHYGQASHPWLGVGLYSVDPSVAAAMNLSVDRGAVIAELAADSPAEAAGLRTGDVIIRFRHEEIDSVADLVLAIRTSEVGEEVEIVFVRGQDTEATSAQLVERPSS